MKIHIISNSLKLNSGFSVVAKHLALGLIKLGHVVNMTGMQTVYIPEYSYGIEQLPLGYTPLDEITQATFNIQYSKPDVVICTFQGDTDLNKYLYLHPNTFFYIPIESRYLPDQMESELKEFVQNKGRIVAQCKYGYDELVQAGIKAEKYIYHGYDPTKFYQIQEKEFKDYCYYSTDIGQTASDPEQLHLLNCYGCNSDIQKNQCKNYKEEIITIIKYIDNRYLALNFPVTKITELFKDKSFVYLFVGQNHGVRKRIERLIEAYANLIVKDQELRINTELHLHTIPFPTSPFVSGINLLKIISRLSNKLGMNIEENITFSYGNFRSSSFSEETLNQLYNIADVNVSASSGEGWGLPILEGMATGLPMIGPNCSSFTELINAPDRGYLSKVDYQLLPNMSERALVDINSLSEYMKHYYYLSKMEKDRMSRNCIQFAKQYTWDKVIPEWNQLIEQSH